MMKSESVLVRLTLVFLGGVCGTLARWALVELMPTTSMWSVMLANVVGSFLLGGLYGLGMRSVPPLIASAQLRLFLGIGLLGSFTTYSSFALAVLELSDSQVLGAIVLACAQVILGVLAAILGLVVGQGREQK